MKTNSESKLKRRDIIKSWLIWLFFSHSCYNYERMQGLAFCHAMSPLIEKLYKTKEERAAALKRHLVFFNTEPNVGTPIHGIVIAMEEEKAAGAEDITDEAINSVKAGLMGPLAGIGDTITQGTLTPLFIAFGIGIALQGNVLGPILYIILISLSIIGISYFGWMAGYKQGKKAVLSILKSGMINKIISGAGIVGCMVLGALIAKYVNVSTPVVFTAGEQQVALQADIFDVMVPKILPLLATLGCYKLLDKKMNPMMVMLIIVAVGLVGGLIGLF